MLGTIGGLALGAGSLAANIGMGFNAANKQESLQRETNAMNERLMREGWARDDSKFQRTTSDMRAAGLNPILAAGGGTSTSAPVRMDTAQTGTMRAQGVSEGTARAQQAFEASTHRQGMLGTLEAQRAQTDYVKAQTGMLETDQALKLAQISDLMSVSGHRGAQQVDMGSQQRLRDAQINKMVYEQAEIVARAKNIDQDTAVKLVKEEMDKHDLDISIDKSMPTSNPLGSGVVGSVNSVLQLLGNMASDRENGTTGSLGLSGSISQLLSGYGDLLFNNDQVNWLKSKLRGIGNALIGKDGTDSDRRAELDKVMEHLKERKEKLYGRH